MTQKPKKIRPSRLRIWIISVSIFLIMLLVFFTIDRTSLEPNLNDSNNIAGKAAERLTESKFFNEWISPFSFPLFNLATTLFVLVLLGKAITDIFLIKRNKQNYS